MADQQEKNDDELVDLVAALYKEDTSGEGVANLVSAAALSTSRGTREAFDRIEMTRMFLSGTQFRLRPIPTPLTEPEKPNMTQEQVRYLANWLGNRIWQDEKELHTTSIARIEEILSMRVNIVEPSACGCSRPCTC